MFKLNTLGFVVRIADNATLPVKWQNGAPVLLDPDSPLNAEFLAWVALGNTPVADPPPPLTQDQLDAVAARAYAKLTALKAMTPAQVIAFVQANVTNLVQAQDAIATLAIAVSILARRI